jgi:hypothetical protein
MKDWHDLTTGGRNVGAFPEGAIETLGNLRHCST